MSTPPDKSQTGGSAGKAVSTPNKKPSSKSYKETVIIIVGPLKEAYTLHKDLLCFYSDFFRAAFTGSFQEATGRKIELPEIGLETFEAFQAWLYTQKLPANEKAPSKTYLAFSLLVNLWIFGDKYQIPLLQNNVVDAMVRKIDKGHEVPLSVLNTVYENTLPKSALRRVVVDIMAHRSVMLAGEGSIVTCFTHPHVWPVHACLDVMAVMCAGWTNGAVSDTIPKKEKCHYHVHAEGEHC